MSAIILGCMIQHILHVWQQGCCPSLQQLVFLKHTDACRLRSGFTTLWLFAIIACMVKNEFIILRSQHTKQKIE